MGNQSKMLARYFAIVIFTLLSILPVESSVAFAGENGHCRAPEQTTSVDEQTATSQDACSPQKSHDLAPCMMSGSCTLAGCMTALNLNSFQHRVLTFGVKIRFQKQLPVHGLGLEPLLEPPRA